MICAIVYKGACISPCKQINMLGHSLRATHLLSSVSITRPPGQSQPVVHTVMHTSLFTLSQVNVQELAQVEYT